MRLKLFDYYISDDEYTDMILIYDACNGNLAEAARQYALQYQARRHPSTNVIRCLEQRLREIGNLPLTSSAGWDRPRTVRTPETEDVFFKQSRIVSEEAHEV